MIRANNDYYNAWTSMNAAIQLLLSQRMRLEEMLTLRHNNALFSESRLTSTMSTYRYSENGLGVWPPINAHYAVGQITFVGSRSVAPPDRSYRDYTTGQLNFTVPQPSPLTPHPLILARPSPAIGCGVIVTIYKHCQKCFKDRDLAITFNKS